MLSLYYPIDIIVALRYIIYNGGVHMAVSEDKTRTIISLEKDLKAKLESLAKQEDRSFNNYVVKILKDHVQSLEGKE